MASVHEQLSEQFFKWESRGRGWQVFAEPVYPEPPFQPFIGHFLPEAPAIDDGRRATFLSSLFRKPEAPVIAKVEEEPEPNILIRDQLIELQTSLPADLNIPKEAFDQFLSNLSLSQEPIAFELLGLHQSVVAQFALHEADAPLARRQLQAYFPEAVFQPQAGALERAWDSTEGEHVLAVEFGLEREFMFPLASGKLDPFIGIIGALSELQPAELGLFQVIFQPVQNKWADSITRAVTHADGKPFFVNMPELAGAAENKVARPLYAAVVRIMVRTEQYERTVQIATDIAASLRVFINPQGNALVPLANDGYPFEDHITDVICRQSRRSGMLLNADELMGFVHLPSSAIRSPVLQREVGKTKAAPAKARNSNGILLGQNTHMGQTVPVRLTPDQRVRHTHIIGGSGKGKSTLLFNLIRQDIENGEGVGVLDPHGDLVNKILGIIPPDRIDDVVLVDPSDQQYSVGFNILTAHTDTEKTLLASDLVSVFRRLSTSWGDQMGSVLNNAILVFLESRRGGTISDLRRFLIEPAYRAEILKTVHDSELIYYWQKSFPLLSGNQSKGPILTRLETFLAPKPIRFMVSQPENRLNFGEIMDSGKIFLAKLPEGIIGRENSFLLGSLLVAKFQQLAMARQEQEESLRRDFWLYIDEFPNFITPSMAQILRGTRKYRIGLTLAHQELRQLERESEVASAIMTNPETRIYFGVSDDDARKLAQGLTFFEAQDLQNLETGHAICRIEKASQDFNLTIPNSEPIPIDQAKATRAAVEAASRQKYARPRVEIEASLLANLGVASPVVEPKHDPVPQVAEKKPAEILKPVSLEDKEELEPAIAATSDKPLMIDSGFTKPVSSEVDDQVQRDLGRGGALHTTIQQRIQGEAHKLGLFAEVEAQLNKTGKAADLVLRGDNLAIAVEIAITNTVDREFANVKKCLAAGFQRVAVISSKIEHLKDIADSVHAGLGAEQSAKVGYFTADEFISELKRIVHSGQPKTTTDSKEKVLGYSVSSQTSAHTPEDQKAKDEAIIKIMAKVMRRKT